MAAPSSETIDDRLQRLLHSYRPESPATTSAEEVESDGAHVIDSAPQSFYISGEEQDIVTLYFSNAPKGGRPGQEGVQRRQQPFE